MDGADEELGHTHFLVHNDVHFDTGLSFAAKDSVETVVFMELARPPQVQLRREPPVLVGCIRCVKVFVELRRGIPG